MRQPPGSGAKPVKRKCISMRQLFQLAAVAAAFLVAAPAAASVTFNSTPSNGFNYGAGNNYAPANAAVSTGTSGEIALRFHQTGVAAPASDSAGVYSFALGTTPISFDWYLEPANRNYALTSSITVANVGTGQTASYNPFFVGNDNFTDGSSFQNSARLNFGFLLGAGFTPNVDSTYSVTFANNGDSLTTFAKLGAGATTGAVPEPATWAMMLIGFGAAGVSLRRRTRTTLQAA